MATRALLLAGTLGLLGVSVPANLTAQGVVHLRAEGKCQSSD